jgi:hypothetical protein
MLHRVPETGLPSSAPARCLKAAPAARLPDAEVELIDIQTTRRSIATALGCRCAVPQEARPEADIVIHANGTPEGLAMALALAGDEATVLEMSAGMVQVPLGGAFHSRRLTLRASQVGAVPANKGQRWSQRRRFPVALGLLCDPIFDVLLSRESAFSGLLDLMPRLTASPEGRFLSHALLRPNRGPAMCSITVSHHFMDWLADWVRLGFRPCWQSKSEWCNTGDVIGGDGPGGFGG